MFVLPPPPHLSPPPQLSPCPKFLFCAILTHAVIRNNQHIHNMEVSWYTHGMQPGIFEAGIYSMFSWQIIYDSKQSIQ